MLFKTDETVIQDSYSTKYNNFYWCRERTGECLCCGWGCQVREEEGVAKEEGGEGDSKQLTDIIDIVIDIIRFPGVAEKEGGGGNKQFTVIPEISQFLTPILSPRLL